MDIDIYIYVTSDEKHSICVTYSVVPQNKRKPLKNRILTTTSRLGKVHSMHCKILLKYHRKYWNHRNLGAAALA